MKASELTTILDQARGIIGSDPEVEIVDQSHGNLANTRPISEIDISVCIGKVVIWS